MSPSSSEQTTSDKVSAFFSRWWTLSTSSRVQSPHDAKNLLPIYAEDHPSPPLQLVDEDPLLLQNEVGQLRRAIESQYDGVTQRFHAVDRALKSTQNTASSWFFSLLVGELAFVEVNRYLQNEWTVLPKAAAITIGGLAGFVLGLKRSRARRVLYSTTGLLTMAAFCYPNETVDVIRTGIAHSRSTWENFRKSPEPPSAKMKTDLSPPKD